TLANVDLKQLEARFPLGTSFDGPQPTAASTANHNNRPAAEPNGFTVRVIVTSGALSGQDRRNLYVHHDADLLPGFPKLLASDGARGVGGAGMGGHVYAWDSRGHLLWRREANPDYSGRPLQPFVNVRRGKRYRTQHGFIASPVIADLNGDGRPEVIAAGMDR